MSKFETQTSDDADMQLLSSGELEQVAGGCFGIRLKVTYERHNGHLDRVTKFGSFEISRQHIQIYRMGFPPA